MTTRTMRTRANPVQVGVGDIMSPSLSLNLSHVAAGAIMMNLSFSRSLATAAETGVGR